MTKVKVLNKKDDDSKKVETLLQEIEFIRKDVIDYQQSTERLFNIKDKMIEIQEQRIALYKKDEANSFKLFIIVAVIASILLIVNIILI